MAGGYSQAFIEQALVKAYARDGRTITAVADDLNINHHTLRYWMKKKKQSGAPANQEKRPQDWSPAEQLQALQESHGLDGEALHAWCRERGIFPHHLSAWKAAFSAPAKEAVAARDLRDMKDEIARLKREVDRKDKALAEAAALLVLQKKYRALWEDGEK
jgi:transposase-like protein